MMIYETRIWTSKNIFKNFAKACTSFVFDSGTFSMILKLSNFPLINEITKEANFKVIKVLNIFFHIQNISL